jgi:hypothetical protein
VAPFLLLIDEVAPPTEMPQHLLPSNNPKKETGQKKKKTHPGLLGNQ